MGAYKLDSIRHDFEVATRNVWCGHTETLLEISRRLLAGWHDNQAKDMAISHLLQAAGMLAASIIMSEQEEAMNRAGESPSPPIGTGDYRQLGTL